MSEPTHNDVTSGPASATRGDWVRITRTILEPGERSPNLPEDTRATPFQLWINGYLDQDAAAVGDDVVIRTAIGRTQYGRLVTIGPRYAHDYGDPQPELLAAADDLRRRAPRT